MQLAHALNLHTPSLSGLCDLYQLHLLKEPNGVMPFEVLQTVQIRQIMSIMVGASINGAHKARRSWGIEVLSCFAWQGALPGMIFLELLHDELSPVLCFFRALASRPAPARTHAGRPDCPPAPHLNTQTLPPSACAPYARSSAQDAQGPREVCAHVYTQTQTSGERECVCVSFSGIDIGGLQP